MFGILCAPTTILVVLGLQGNQLPHIVTSDKNFKDIIEAEGYGVIDPEKVSPQDLQKKWA